MTIFWPSNALSIVIALHCTPDRTPDNKILWLIDAVLCRTVARRRPMDPFNHQICQAQLFGRIVKREWICFLLHGLALHLSYQSEALVPGVLQTSTGIPRRSRLTVEERNEEDERSAQRQQHNYKTMTLAACNEWEARPKSLWKPMRGRGPGSSRHLLSILIF